MRTAARFRVGTFVVVSVVCGISLGRSANAAPAEPASPLPAALSSLIPSDAVAVLYLESSDAAAADMGAFAPDGAAAQGAPGFDVLALLTRTLGIGADRLDPTRPLAVAVALPAAGQTGAPPTPTFILPCRDLEGLKADLANRPGMATTPVVRDDYVGIGTTLGYAGGGSASTLVADLPARTAVLRVRAAEIVTALRPMIDVALAQMSARTNAAALPDSVFPDPNLARQMAAAQQMQSAMMTRMVEALAATPLLELSVDVAGGQLEIGYAMQLGSGGAAKYCLPASTVGLADLARGLPRDYPLIALMANDYDALADLYEPWYQAMAELEPSPAMPFAMPPARVTASMELMRAMGDHSAMAGRFGEAGLEAVYILTADSPQQFLELLRRGIESGPIDGIEETFTKGPAIEGIQTSVYTQRIDFERVDALSVGVDSTFAAARAQQSSAILRQLFGPDGLTARIAPMDDKLVMAIGPDPEPLARAVRALRATEGLLPAGLEAMDTRSRDALVLWGEAELHSLLLPLITAIAASDPSSVAIADALRESPRCIAAARGFLENDRLHGDYRIDLAMLREFVRSAAAKQPAPPAGLEEEGPEDEEQEDY